jgi:hypothetical protein
MAGPLKMGEQLFEDISSIEVVVFEQRFKLGELLGRFSARSCIG